MRIRNTDHEKASVSNNFFHTGRFGNSFFTGMALHFIAKKNDLQAHYRYYDDFKKLGVELYDGKIQHDEKIKPNDDNFFNYIIGDNIHINVELNNSMWCQTKEFALYLKTYFNEYEQKINIISSNIYKEKYDNNDDVFVHIRLGDIANNYAQPLEYYDKILNEIKFKNGYISSDSIEHDTCQFLIKKYNLKEYNSNEVDTIMFASVCKHIVLSAGTFSWMVGLFAYYSKIYYPKIYKKWHGDIFVFPEWVEIDY